MCLDALLELPLLVKTMYVTKTRKKGRQPCGGRREEEAGGERAAVSGEKERRREARQPSILVLGTATTPSVHLPTTPTPPIHSRERRARPCEACMPPKGSHQPLTIAQSFRQPHKTCSRVGRRGGCWPILLEQQKQESNHTRGPNNTLRVLSHNTLVQGYQVCLGYFCMQKSPPKTLRAANHTEEEEATQTRAQQPVFLSRFHSFSLLSSF